ncbi:Mitochondrial import inner membrane translocase subunit tim8 [Dimargaris xerosporica]|nr:Mitochondrial import inner membrane translocase subunit tim8 [Dimargaris xerosporica]
MSDPVNHFSNLDEESQKEMAKFIEMEQGRARLQQAVHRYTDLCWDKCISHPSSKLNRTDETCLSNCVERFLDTSIYVVTHLDSVTSS